MEFTNLQLVEFVTTVQKRGARYWYGTFGLIATTSLYNSKKGQYPSHYTAARAATYKKEIEAGAWVTDCIGIIKYFFWSGNDPTKPAKYNTNGFPDYSANMTISELCEKTGPISSIPEIPGLVVWCNGHIGVYIGDGWVIEARGFAYGVVKTKIKDRTWTKWGKLKSKYLKYVEAAIPAPKPERPLGSRPIGYGDEGEDVKTAQKLLIDWNYSVGKWGADGEFGSATKSAVEAWQHDNKLPVTGRLDDDDFALINEILFGKPAPVPEPEQPDDPTAVQPEDAPDRYVTVTKGNTVNIRTAPSADAPKLGIAKLHDVFEYADETAANGWYKIYYNAEIAWISGLYTSLSDGGTPELPELPEPPKPTVPYDKAVIVDMFSHTNLRSAKNDWPKIAKSIHMGILRTGRTSLKTAPIGIGADDDFVYAAKKCKEHGIPFGTFWYNNIPADRGNITKAEWARNEAWKYYELASPHKPLFYCADVEEDVLTDGSIIAFVDELRKLGAKRIGIYIGQSYHAKHKAVIEKFDFVWIPRYGKNDGTYKPQYDPIYPCDIHQYSDMFNGTKFGFADETIDINRLTGSKSLEWFLQG